MKARGIAVLLSAFLVLAAADAIATYAVFNSPPRPVFTAPEVRAATIPAARPLLTPRGWLVRNFESLVTQHLGGQSACVKVGRETVAIIAPKATGCPAHSFSYQDLFVHPAATVFHTLTFTKNVVPAVAGRDLPITIGNHLITCGSRQSRLLVDLADALPLSLGCAKSSACSSGLCSKPPTFGQTCLRPCYAKLTASGWWLWNLEKLLHRRFPQSSASVCALNVDPRTSWNFSPRLLAVWCSHPVPSSPYLALFGPSVDPTHLRMGWFYHSGEAITALGGLQPVLIGGRLIGCLNAGWDLFAPSRIEDGAFHPVCAKAITRTVKSADLLGSWSGDGGDSESTGLGAAKSFVVDWAYRCPGPQIAPRLKISLRQRQPGAATNEVESIDSTVNGRYGESYVSAATRIRIGASGPRGCRWHVWAFRLSPH